MSLRSRQQRHATNNPGKFHQDLASITARIHVIIDIRKSTGTNQLPTEIRSILDRRNISLRFTQSKPNVSASDQTPVSPAKQRTC
jgi:hypothetical protein